MIRRLGSALVILSLFACAQQGGRLEESGFTPDPALSALDDWQLSGRLALSNGRDGGSGELNWTHQTDRDALRFHAALGQGSWRLDVDPQQATMRLSDGSAYQAADIEALIETHLDWQIPVTELVDWLKGIPAPGPVTRLDLDLEGRIRSMNQAGWHIEYGGYLDVGALHLPRKIIVRRGDQQVRLLIRQWAIDR